MLGMLILILFWKDFVVLFLSSLVVCVFILFVLLLIFFLEIDVREFLSCMVLKFLFFKKGICLLWVFLCLDWMFGGSNLMVVRDVGVFFLVENELCDLMYIFFFGVNILLIVKFLLKL